MGLGLANLMVEDWAVIGAAPVAASVLALHFLQAQWKSRQTEYRLPPGPPRWPIIGNVPQLAIAHKMPHRYTVELAKTYGPVMLLNLGASNVLYVSDPKIADECLKGPVFVDRARNGAITHLSFGTDVHPVISAYGDYWRLLRKLMHAELLSNGRMQQFEGVRAEETHATVRELFEASKGNNALPVRRSVTGLLMNNMTRLMMSKKFGQTAAEEGSESKEWRESVGQIFHLFFQPMVEDVVPALAWVDVVSGLRGSMQRVLEKPDKILQRTLDARKKDLLDNPRTEQESRDFLDVMLLADGGRALSERAIKAIIVDLVGAGTETTSNTVEWTLSELLANPHIMKKVQEEVDRVVGTERIVKESDIDNLPYLQAVVRETYRLRFGPWGFPRSSNVESKLAGYDIPANCTLIIQLWGMGRDPAIWEDPLKFDPERYLGSNAEEMLKRMAFSPFGSGKRMCPGDKLGALMVYYVLARLIHSFEWSLPNGIRPEELDMEETFGLALERRTPLTAVLKPRLPLHLY